MSKQVSWQTFQETVASHLGLTKTEITEATHLFDTLGMDSLGVLSLGMKLHAIFRIKVPLSAVSQIATVGDMFRVMNEYADK